MSEIPRLPLALGALVFFVGARGMACPMCAAAQELTISAQELVYAEHSVLAIPVAGSNEFRIVQEIKGDTPADGRIAGAVFRADASAIQSQKPLLLVRDESWLSWVNFGPVNAEQAGWLRQLSATKCTTEMTSAEWREHVAYFLPYLENPEPMVAEIAFNEFASAPYGALRSLKPRLDVATIRTWLDNPKLTARQRVYLLLLGIAGTAQDAQWLEKRMESARKTHDATNLAALLGAGIELRGPAGVEQIEKLYLTDPERTKPETEAALLALKVHGDAAGAVPRSRVIQAFLLFRSQHPSMAGLVARELAKWSSWESRSGVDPERLRDAVIRRVGNQPSIEVRVTPDSASSR